MYSNVFWRPSIRKTRLLGVAAALALLATLFATAPAGAIINGAPVNAGSQENMAIGRLRTAGGGWCTATLISPNLVLTAAHCVSSQVVRPQGGIDQVRDPIANISFRVDNTGNGNVDFGDTALDVLRVEFPPEYRQKTGPGNGADIALVELTAPVIGVTPFQLDYRDVDPGDRITFYGRGQRGPNTSAFDQNANGVLQVGSAVVSSRTCGNGDPLCLNGVDNGTSASCNGDSGGPGFIGGSGITTVHIASETTGCAQDVVIQVEVGRYEGWIRETVIGTRRCNGLVPTVVMDLGETPTGVADVILGTAARDVIRGLNGHDTICGRGGHDLIYGGNGRDRIYGGNGRDEIRGNAGNDTLFGSCLLYTSPSPRDRTRSRMPSSA